MGKLPQIFVILRREACGNCSCEVDFEDPCSSCPMKKWGKKLCGQILATKNTEPNSPNLKTMVQSASNAAKNWVAGGFAVSDKEEIQKRLDICKSCEFWNGRALGGTGRCKKCGCSTWAKIRMATEKCPIGKWGPETISS